MTELALVVLAAGMGTRMKSAIPKVLHKIAGRSMLGHVLHAGRALGARQAVVVLGPDMGSVQKEASGIISGCRFAEQRDRLGTGHAVSMANDTLEFGQRLLRHRYSVASAQPVALFRDRKSVV